MTDIDWSKQPTPEHVWIEDLNPDSCRDFSGWGRLSGEKWVFHNRGGFCNRNDDKNGHIKIHRKPEQEYIPKVGDIVDLISKRDNLDSVWEAMLLCVGNQSVFVRGYDGESMYSLGCFDIKPHKSDKDLFIEKAVAVMNAVIGDSQEGLARAMYAHGARFTDE